MVLNDYGTSVLINFRKYKIKLNIGKIMFFYYNNLLVLLEILIEGFKPII